MNIEKYVEKLKSNLIGGYITAIVIWSIILITLMVLIIFHYKKY